MGFRVPEQEIKDRIKRVQQKLVEKDIGALFVTQRVDLFYFKGQHKMVIFSFQQKASLCS